MGTGVYVFVIFMFVTSIAMLVEVSIKYKETIKEIKNRDKVFGWCFINDDFKVGDEIIYAPGRRGIIIREAKNDESKYTIITQTGTVKFIFGDNIAKTGRYVINLSKLFERWEDDE